MSEPTLGPTGGSGGQEFSDYAAPAGTAVCELHIFIGNYVDAIQLAYAGADDVLVRLPKIGGQGLPSAGRHVLTLDADESITGISGRSGKYVDSIRIHTNKRTSDSFGGHGGEHDYRFEVADNEEIAGFFGRADWFVDALGVIVRKRTVVPVAAAAVAAAPVAPAAKAPKAKAPAKATAPVTAAAPVAAEAPAEAPVVPAAKPAKATVAKTIEVQAKPAESAPTRSAAVVELAARAPRRDDLEKVEGIGPKIAEILIENGIPDLQALAATPVEQLSKILSAAGARYRFADPTTWPQQAALGASGDWAGMEALKAALKGGRKK